MSTNSILTSPFAQQVISVAKKGCDKLESGEVRTARQVCGTSFWMPLSRKQRTDAGKVISEAVKSGLLPLRRLRRSTSNHQRYEKS